MSLQMETMSFKITEKDNSFQNIKKKSTEKDESILSKSIFLHKFSTFVILVASLTILGLLAESIIFAKELLEVSSIFGYLYITILSAVIYYVAIFLYREISSFIDLSRVEKIQADISKFQKNPTKENLNFVKQLLIKYENSENSEVLQGVKDFKANLSELKYENVVSAISEQIILPIDKEVEKLIFQYAKENSIATAISPVAIFDAMFVIWRNIRMINKILNLYGFRAGILGNLTLLRKVAEQLIFIGVTEIAEESVGVLTTQTITSKLSSSIAQGVGLGILTVRVGLATIQVARPIEKKSDISYITKFLKSFIPNPFKKNS